MDLTPKHLGVNLYSVIYKSNTFLLSLIRIFDILHRVVNRVKRRQFMIPDFYDFKKKYVQLEDGREQGQLNEQLCREVYGG